jgi:hypothetical protein
VTYWTLPQNDNTVDFAVLTDSAFGADEGTVLQVANAAGAIVYTNGDYSAGCAWVGVGYDAVIELSEFAVRNEQGITVNQGSLQLRDLTVRHRNTGYYQIQVVPDDSKTITRETTLEISGNDIENQGRSRSFVGQRAERVTINIRSDNPKPVTIATVEAEADWSDKSL